MLAEDGELMIDIVSIWYATGQCDQRVEVKREEFLPSEQSSSHPFSARIVLTPKVLVVPGCPWSADQDLLGPGGGRILESCLPTS